MKKIELGTLHFILSLNDFVHIFKLKFLHFVKTFKEDNLH